MKSVPIGLVLFLGACQAPPAVPTDEAVAGLQTAAGRSAWAAMALENRGILMTGQALLMGRDESFELLLAGDGRYRFSTTGPLGKLEVCDGDQIYRRDLSGVSRRLDLADLESAPVMASLMTGAWIDSKPLLEVEAEVFAIGARGLRVETEQGLAHRAAAGAGDRGAAIWLSDWSPHAGVSLPGLIEIGIGGSVPPSSRLQVEEWAPVELSSSSFEIELGVPGDHDFAGPGEAIETFRLATGHLAVKALVNGKDVGWFLLDSGAGSEVLDQAVAEQLGLTSIGDVRAVGVSGGSAASFVRVDELQIGRLRWRQPLFVAIDLKPISDAIGLPIAGVLGYGLFSRAVVAMDAKQVTLIDPVGFEPESGWPAVDLVFEGKAPCAEASFLGIDGPEEAWFRLDTGSDGYVTFHSQAVKRYGLLINRETRPITYAGVGGNSFGYNAQLEWFELAGRRLVDIEVGLALENQGTFGSAHLAGNVGQAMFAGSRLIFDYSRDRLHFAPGATESE